MGTGFDFEAVNASDYDDLRPNYAPEAVAWVADRGALGEGSLVVDLAAGTGQLARQFTLHKAELVAVEPALNMRRVIQERLPTVRALEGSAEAIPLGDGKADALVVGNAFHHFETERAFSEIRRVLHPSAAFGLFWAWTDDETYRAYPELRRVEEAVECSRAAGGMATAIVIAYQGWKDPPSRACGFTPFERAEFPTFHNVPSARLAELYATSSDVASLPPDVRADLLVRIQRISQKLPDLLRMPGRTVVDLCFREAAVG